MSVLPLCVIPTEELAPSPAQKSAPPRTGIRNWSEIEIAVLAQAWCKVNEDAAGPGSAQDRFNLYNKVSNEFKKLSKDGAFVRTGKSCEGKWPSVQAACNKWVGAVAHVTRLNRSGWNENQEYEEAQKNYKLRNKEKYFTHILAFKEIEKHEKWSDWSNRNKAEPEPVGAYDRQGARRGVPRVPQPMGHKRAKFAAAQADALMKNVIDLDEEEEVLSELERGKIAVGLELGAELKRSNELLIMGKDLHGMDVETALYWQEQKDDILFMRKKRREDAEAATSFATAGNAASDDMPESEVVTSLDIVLATQV